MNLLISSDEAVARLERLVKLIDELKRLHDPSARRALLARMTHEIHAATDTLTPVTPQS